MGDDKAAILQGTLDLMVLKTLDAMGPMHGYGIARRIEQIGEQALQINQGTIYLCLVRLVQKGWITAEWGSSINNRRAKFYAISRAGRRQLIAEAQDWKRISSVIDRLLLQGSRRSCGQAGSIGSSIRSWSRTSRFQRMTTSGPD
jgi:PadR family transcriptional regulator PadR